MNKEHQLEENLIKQLTELKYNYRPDIVDRKTLEQNFKTKFEALNRIHLSESEFLRLREEVINPDVFAASRMLREQNYFQREDGTPLHDKKISPRARNFRVGSLCIKGVEFDPFNSIQLPRIRSN